MNRREQRWSGGGFLGQREGVAAGRRGVGGLRTLVAVVGLAEHRREPPREQTEHEREPERDATDAGRAGRARCRRAPRRAHRTPRARRSRCSHAAGRRAAPMRPTIAPAASASSPPMSTLSFPPSTTAPVIVSNAPITMNGVAAPSSLRRSSTAPTPRNTTPMTSATAAVRVGGVFGVRQRCAVGRQPEVGVGAAARDLALERDDGVAVAPGDLEGQPAREERSAPARKIARPFVQPTGRAEVAREGEQVDAAECRCDRRCRRRRARRPR